MTFDDWLLALHLLSAFAMVGALTLFWVLIYALRSANPTPSRVLALKPAMVIGTAAVMVGVVGTFVFGIWLAITVDAFRVWDLWVLLAIVGWLISAGVGQRAGAAFGIAFAHAGALAGEGRNEPDAELTALAHNQRATMMHGISHLFAVLVLIDMIWKPGA